MTQRWQAVAGRRVKGKGTRENCLCPTSVDLHFLEVLFSSPVFTPKAEKTEPNTLISIFGFRVICVMKQELESMALRITLKHWHSADDNMKLI